VAKVPSLQWAQLSAPSFWLSWRLVGILLLFVVMVFMTAYPVGLLFLSSFQTNRPGEAVTWGLEGWRIAFADPTIPQALANTLALGLFRTLLATALAIFFAWAITRTDMPGKGFIEFIMWLGFFLPHLPITIGWIILLDPDFGLINKLLMNTFGLTAAPFSITSYWGIVWAHIGFSTSLRFLLITPAFRAMDAALEEAARTSGASGTGTLMRITIPILAPVILATTALGFIRSLESFEIEMLLGVPAGIFVYSTKIWELVHWEPARYGPATALSSVFLLAIFLMVWLQRVMLGRRDYTTVTGRGYSVRPTPLGRWKWPLFAFCVGFVTLTVLLPLVFLILGTFMRLFGFFQIENPWTLRNWAEAFNDRTFVRALRNSLVLGVGAGLVGALFYAVVSYVLVRTRFFGRGLVDFLSWLPWALPGVLISLALLWTFLGSGKLFTPLYGTIYLLILAIIIKELPLGTQVFKPSIMQIGRELEEAGWVSGASWFQTYRRVLLPLLMPTLVAVSLIVFIAAIRDIPTVVFLSSFESRTLSLLMLDYVAEGKFEKATVIGVFISSVIVVVAILGRTLGLRLGPGHRG
jgi:iron(III) transport system permease protein